MGEILLANFQNEWQIFGVDGLPFLADSYDASKKLYAAQKPFLEKKLAEQGMVLLYAVAFAFLYHYLPDRRVAWRQAFLGGAITALLFALGRYLIGLYLAQAAPGSAYGSMGALVLLLLWMYYAAVVFFAGALITAVIDERSHSRRRLREAGIGNPSPASAPP